MIDWRFTTLWDSGWSLGLTVEESESMESRADVWE
jgi:hypothetical protein